MATFFQPDPVCYDCFCNWIFTHTGVSCPSPSTPKTLHKYYWFFGVVLICYDTFCFISLIYCCQNKFMCRRSLVSSSFPQLVRTIVIVSFFFIFNVMGSFSISMCHGKQYDYYQLSKTFFIFSSRSWLCAIKAKPRTSFYHSCPRLSYWNR